MTIYFVIGVIYFIVMLTYIMTNPYPGLGPYYYASILSRVNFYIQKYGYVVTFGMICLAVVASICFWPIEIIALLYRKYK